MNTKETIYETYVRTICRNCSNRKANLCDVKRRVDGSLKCIYYDREKRK